MCFFFSSRRRHTRFDCDWSSDVCSSDLSYCGAQIFEALGLGAEVIDRCFTGTVSIIGGIGFAEIAEDVLARNRAAYPAEAAQAGLPDFGRVRFRKEGEDHAWSPPIVKALQRAIGDGATGGDGYADFLSRLTARAPASPPPPPPHPSPRPSPPQQAAP